MHLSEKPPFEANPGGEPAISLQAATFVAQVWPWNPGL
jgi:hypothetical protein